ncbi:MAG TPA: hypothetical protein VG944_16700 [Fimbriimonas sp.]|nr:hypothetical protein [Fimbriimonas sp.]
MSNGAWWKLKTVEAPLYHSGEEIAGAGKYEGQQLSLAMYVKDGCVYCASHVDHPPVTIVNGRKLRKNVWPMIYQRLTHVPAGAYKEAAKIIDELNTEHGHCWTTVFRGNDGDISKEFLDKVHENNVRKLPEDPFISTHAVVHK